MKGFILYETHTALNLHFNPKTNYDYFKYHGKTKVTEEGFKKLKNRWQYAGLESKLDHLMWFMYCSYKEQDWSYIPPQSLFFKGRTWLKSYHHNHPNEHLKNNIKTDLQWLKSVYNDPSAMFNQTGLYPNLYQDYKDSCVSLETVLLFDLYVGTVFNVSFSDDIVAWPTIVAKMMKVSPFVEQLFPKSEFVQQLTEIYSL